MKRQNHLRMSQRVSWPLLVALNLLFSQPGAAVPFELSYLGRLTDASGMPISGPIDIELNFYRSETGSDRVAISALRFNSLSLADGVFQLNIALSPSQFHTVFPDSADSVYVEVTDVTHGKTYKRQKYNTVPYALKVPTDGTTIGYTADGKLSVKGLKGASLPASAPADGQVLKWRTSTGWEWGNDETGGSGAAVTSSQIQDGTLVNADISSSAAIAGSKITPNFGTQVITGDGSGLFNVPSGALGTSIDSAEILDGTIADADVSATAAIAQSKISGLSTSLAAKEPLISTGNAAQYFKGDKSWATLDTSAVIENGSQYFTDARARSAINVNTPLQYSSATGTISIPAATSVANGYLTTADWLTFSNKMEPISSSTVLNAGSLSTALQAGVEIKPFGPSGGQVGELRFLELTSQGSNFVGFRAPDAISATTIWTLPSYDGSAGQVLSTNGSGALSWVSGGGGGGGVTSITAGVGLSGGVINTTGTIGLSDTGVTAGNYSNPSISIDNQGRITAASTGSVNLSSGVSGTLPIAYGGTGATTASGARTTLGLGSLSTLSTVTDSEISNETISQNKITGLVTSLSSKEGSINLGSGTQYWRGDKTWQDFNTSVRSAITAQGALSFNSGTGVITTVSDPNFQEIRVGAGHNATPAPQARIQGASTGSGISDTTGSSLVLAAGNGTGTGGSGNIIFETSQPQGSGTAPGSMQARMVVTREGKVGIGTTMPNGLLEVFNSGGGSPQFVLRDPNPSGKASVTLSTQTKNLIMGLGNTSSSFPDKFFIHDESSSTTRLVIDSNGNLGIGTVSPANRLDIEGDTRTTGCFKHGPSAGTNVGGTCGSDARFKTDIAPITGSLARFASLRPVHYRYKAAAFPGRGFGDALESGFIAQELREVYPELVQEDQDGYLKVHYGLKLQMETIAAVKELAAENEQLKATAADLKARAEKAEAETAQIKSETEEMRSFLCGQFPAAPFCSK